MADKIEHLELLARQLEPSPEQRNRWNAAARAYADAFLNQIETLNAFDQPPEDGSLSLPFGEEGKPMERLLAEIGAKVDRAGINPASGGHLGYVPGGGVFPAALGDYLAAVTNRYSGIFFANPGAVRMENDLIRWMCRLAGYPKGALGNLASGGSIANLIAITTARDFKGIKATRVEKAVVYLTHQVHHCVQKALRIAGLGEAVIRYIPIDERFRMDIPTLKEQLEKDTAAGLEPFLVAGSAGTTDTGAIDPLNEIASLAEQYGLWFHVDAAYGGFFLLVEDLKDKFRGIERSDSVAIDPHKGLFLPYGLGAVLIKNVKALYSTHYYKANYMQDAHQDWEEASPADLSPELTKHFRGLRMWLPLQLFGLQPFRAALEEKTLLCRYFYQKVQEEGFEVGPEPDLSIMIFRYKTRPEISTEFNEALVEYVRKDGRIFLSSTTIDGEYWIRLAVLSFRTHKKQIDLCLGLLREGVRKLKTAHAQLKNR
ncbi:MAG: aminotransferase class V-fold PLP-dependent enzyme [Phaeodactylibacter sp.]|nr:aminotransferase class V-fold PLP-dependent enzyme [Phaeodactylibacter sp.]MCB9263640.1 aminotransferase class V-fold PLP-dependent enzyme [Lewinellaceae bacterium]MCB9287481.1 aminotransferase class V-fold PLP-dependent enzyme [Lewinellaceae bacterium]